MLLSDLINSSLIGITNNLPVMPSTSGNTGIGGYMNGQPSASPIPSSSGNPTVDYLGNLLGNILQPITKTMNPPTGNVVVSNTGVAPSNTTPGMLKGFLTALIPIAVLGIGIVVVFKLVKYLMKGRRR